MTNGADDDPLYRAMVADGIVVRTEGPPAASDQLAQVLTVKASAAHRRLGQVLSEAFPTAHPILVDWATLGFALKARGRELAAVVEGADAARDFPTNTCPASRHAQDIGEALMRGDVAHLLEGGDAVNCGESILATVTALWLARTERTDGVAPGVPPAPALQAVADDLRARMAKKDSLLDNAQATAWRALRQLELARKQVTELLQLIGDDEFPMQFQTTYDYRQELLRRARSTVLRKLVNEPIESEGGHPV